MKLGVLVLCWVLLSPVVARSQSGFGLIWEEAKVGQDSLPPLLIKATPPARLSYKAYCPAVLDQQDSWACVGYACGYYLMTIVDAINRRVTDSRQINELAYSAGYLYDAIKPQADIRCQAGAKLSTALEFLKTNGIVSQQFYPYEPCEAPRPSIHGIQNRLFLGDFSTLFSLQHGDSTQKIKRLKMALWAGYPVVVGLAVSNTFREAMTGKPAWIPTVLEQQQVQTLGGHALCIIGYDDNRFGGAFEVVNSFGSQWGTRGFGWIPYRVMAKFARLGYQVYGQPVRKGESGRPEELTAEIAVQLMDGERISLQSADSTTSGIWMGTIKHSDAKGYTFLFKNSQPAYTYLFEISTSGTLNRIVPQSDLPDYQPASSEWKDLMGAYSWTVEAEPGQDQFLILLTQQPLDFERIENQIDRVKLSVTPEGIQSLYTQLGVSSTVAAQLSTINSTTGLIRWGPGLTMIPLLVTIRHF